MAKSTTHTAEIEPSRSRSGVMRALSARVRLLLALLALIGALSAVRGKAKPVQAATPEQSLAVVLAREALTLDPKQVVWLASETNALGLRSVLLCARREGELSDVYFAQARMSGQQLLDVRMLTNITRTSSADEAQLAAALPMVAYAAQVGSAYDAVVVLDTRGERADITKGWPWYAKLQNAVTNLQDTGRFEAFGAQRYTFVDAPGVLSLRARKHGFDVLADQRALVINPWHAELPPGSAFDLELAQKGRPGLITWVVDSVRRVSWIGAGPIEWLEHKVFGITDQATRAYHGVVATDTAAEVREALSVKELPAEAAPSTDASIGWPPPALKPLLDDSVRGEGVWLPIVDDPFLADNPQGPPLFYQTFIRVDPERAFTRVYLTAWDSRMVQLGIVMGTKEPESATGETGSGNIPRDPQVISRLVGAFNGGFQALHGEFGMMAEGRVYLPPKPYAATVAVFEDGRVGIGSWPGPGRRDWDEELANSQIPSGMVSMRQNLTSVVEDGKYNPWERWWWGAAPTFAEEQTYIPRSGLCLTGEGALVYFWGELMGPDELGKAMLAANCARGLHLDMNGKHTGFELYRTFSPGVALPALGRELAATEGEGPVEDMRGFNFRTRLAVTTMTPVRFPRYIDRDPRDFFYLTRKATLPGAALEVGGQRLAFSSEGLPSVGFPQAFARAAAADGSFTVTRIDPARAVPLPLAGEGPHRVLARVPGLPAASSGAGTRPRGAGAGSLFARYAYGTLRVDVGRPSRGARVLATGTPYAAGSQALAAIGVDGEGFIVYAEARSPEALSLALQAAGVSRALALENERLQLAAANSDPDALPATAAVDSGDAGAPPSEDSLAFVEQTQAPAEVLFPQVKPMPYNRWGYLQDQRVRYFPTSHEARFKMPGATR